MTDSYTNWLGQTISIGDTIVYPQLSGRSCQMTEGVVLSFRLKSEEDHHRPTEERAQDYWDAHILPTLGQPMKMRVQPTDRSSRWGRFSRGEPKPVNLTANAAGVVKPA